MKRSKQVITASSLACLCTCARKYYLSYELGWRKRKVDAALKFGTAFHKGLEVWFDSLVAERGREAAEGNGAEDGDVLARAAAKALAAAFGTADGEEFDAETAAQLTALLTGYFAKWGGADFTVEPEREFAVRFPFLRGVVVCGKLDGVVRFADGRKGVIEHKTTGEDIGPASDYWNGINRDQIALYKAAMEKEGAVIERVVYDVIRKPTIRQGKDETAEEYGARLAADCIGEQEGDNPRAKGYRRGSGFYFARKEIPLLDCDLDALARRLFVARALLKNYKKIGRQFVSQGIAEIEAWPKCGSTMACRFCAFRGVCGTAELPEAEWERGRAHEELEVARKFLG